jgi:hypothetical protein
MSLIHLTQKILHGRSWNIATRREMTLGRVLGLALGNTLTSIDHGEGRQSFDSANGVETASHRTRNGDCNCEVVFVRYLANRQ